MSVLDGPGRERRADNIEGRGVWAVGLFAFASLRVFELILIGAQAVQLCIGKSKNGPG